MKFRKSYLVLLLAALVAVIVISCNSDEEVAEKTQEQLMEEMGFIVDSNRSFPQYDAALEESIKEAMRTPHPDVNLYDYFVLKETISTKKDSTSRGIMYSWALIIQNVTSDTVILKARLRWETERGQMLNFNIVHGLVLFPDSLHTFSGNYNVPFPQARNVDVLQADVTLE